MTKHNLTGTLMYNTELTLIIFWLYHNNSIKMYSLLDEDKFECREHITEIIWGNHLKIL